MWYRSRRGYGVGYYAELAHRAEVVPAYPVVYGLASLQAVDVDLRDLDLPAFISSGPNGIGNSPVS
jgi:hypothetical protein